MRPVNLALSVIKNRRGGVPRPSWCTYLVCFRCNARCPMCDSWRMKPGREMTPKQVQQVFAKIGRLDVVRLSGGEPFLRDDMLDIAEAVMEQSRPMVLHITTNGSFPDRVEAFVRTFSKSRRLRFMISFDGLEQEHNRSRGDDVTFDRAIETVDRLNAMRRSHGVKVSANHTVISHQSLADNGGLRETLNRRDVEVHSVLAYAESSMYGVKLRGKRADHLIVPDGYPIHPELNGADVVGFTQREISRVREIRDPILRIGKRYYLNGLLDRLHNTNGSNGNGGHNENGNGASSSNALQPKCVALRSHIRLLPDGSVPVCQFNTEVIGNLVDQSFDEVWHGSDARASRSWVDGCPGCWAECEVMPNAIYSGDLFGIR